MERTQPLHLIFLCTCLCLLLISLLFREREREAGDPTSPIPLGLAPGDLSPSLPPSLSWRSVSLSLSDTIDTSSITSLSLSLSLFLQPIQRAVLCGLAPSLTLSLQDNATSSLSHQGDFASLSEYVGDEADGEEVAMVLVHFGGSRHRASLPRRMNGTERGGGAEGGREEEQEDEQGGEQDVVEGVAGAAAVRPVVADQGAVGLPFSSPSLLDRPLLLDTAPLSPLATRLALSLSLSPSLCASLGFGLFQQWWLPNLPARHATPSPDDRTTCLRAVSDACVSTNESSHPQGACYAFTYLWRLPWLEHRTMRNLGLVVRRPHSGDAPLDTSPPSIRIFGEISKATGTDGETGWPTGPCAEPALASSLPLPPSLTHTTLPPPPSLCVAPPDDLRGDLARILMATLADWQTTQNNSTVTATKKAAKPQPTREEGVDDGGRLQLVDVEPRPLAFLRRWADEDKPSAAEGHWNTVRKAAVASIA
mmetsp:Transcript_3813/g.12316  ORF Transcript_3813/g.12316 Transcript_3813/m.12316 type:complete len:479 (-) Transcript_3813:131-1567(-)